MKKNYKYGLLVIGVFVVLYVSPKLHFSIESCINDDIDLFHVSEILVDKEISSSKHFVIYKSKEDEICAAMIDKMGPIYIKDSLKPGFYLKYLDDNPEKYLLEECDFEKGYYYFGVILDNQISEISIHGEKMTEYKINDLRLVYFISYGESLDIFNDIVIK